MLKECLFYLTMGCFLMCFGFVIGINENKPTILKIIHYKNHKAITDTYVSNFKECEK